MRTAWFLAALLFATLRAAPLQAFDIQTNRTNGEIEIVVVADREMNWRVRRDGRFLDIVADVDLSALAQLLRRRLSSEIAVEASRSVSGELRVAQLPGRKFSHVSVDPRSIVISWTATYGDVEYRIGRHPGFVRLAIETSNEESVIARLQDDRLSITSEFADRWLDIEKLRRLVPGIELVENTDRSIVFTYPGRMRRFELGGNIQAIDFSLEAVEDTTQTVKPHERDSDVDQLTFRAEVVDGSRETAKVDAEGSSDPSEKPEKAGIFVGGREAQIRDASAEMQEEEVTASFDDIELATLLPAPDIIRGELKISARKEQGSRFVDFDWGRPVPMSVFWRDNRLWLVSFAKATSIDFSADAMRTSLGGQIIKFEQIPDSAVSVLVMEFTNRQPIGLEPASAGWRLEIFEGGYEQSHDGQTSLSLSTAGMLFSPGKAAVEISDPVVGDRITAIVSLSPNGQPISSMETVDFTLMRSLVGLAYATKSRDLSAEVTDRGVRVRRSGGLRVSGTIVSSMPAAAERSLNHLDHEAGEEVGTADATTEASDINIDAALGDNTLPRAYSGLALAELAEMDGVPLRAALGLMARTDRDQDVRGRVEAALDRARLYLVYGLASEALTWTDIGGAILVESDIEPPEDLVRSGRLIKAVARNLRPSTDNAALLNSEFEADPEIEVWRTIAQMRQRDWRFDPESSMRVRELLDRYPKKLRLELGAEFVNGLLEVGQVDVAFAYIDSLERLDGTTPQKAALLRAKGRAFALDGDLERGLGLFEQAEILSDFEDQHELVVERLRMQLDAGEIEPERALAELRPRIPFWRGVRGEADLLSNLGDIWVDAGNIDEALSTWRTATNRDPNIADATISRMRRHFTEFLQGEIWNRSPFAALELQRRYRELLPPGSEGARILMSLAREFAKIELPELAFAIADLASRMPGVELDAFELANLHANLLKDGPHQAGLAGGELDALIGSHPIYTANEVDAIGRQMTIARLSGEPIEMTLDPKASLDDTERRASLWTGRWNGLTEGDPKSLSGSAEEFEPGVPLHLSQGDASEQKSFLASELERFAAEERRIGELTAW